MAIGKGLTFELIIAVHRGRVRQTPMYPLRCTRKLRAGLAGIAANGKHDVQRHSLGPEKLVPTLAARRLATGPFAQLLYCQGVDPAGGVAAGAEGLNVTAQLAIEQLLGDDAAGRIARAQDQQAHGRGIFVQQHGLSPAVVSPMS